ncbi:acyltransferase [Hymenobacter sp. 15J16-1T3B]|uniref:acyltransferase family protein n=1 Tax=Hymenobacter sp. 15J16-1T3B TaxID=2886941 RepID=UPI001D1039E0|nr:acyltransferase [Hymenobacter sp. 15J16-1T3B]MCC3157314.1 acyltransferase [Hymenobacter sp. 15J16-1T3B]
MKPHFPILDGLRGVAAVLVVVFHLFEAHQPSYALHPVHHGYLAVDFFFLLSGFVVGYAYDDRWGRMRVGEFFTIRLVRLHPLILLSVVIGALGFWFDPFMPAAQHVSFAKLLGVALLTLTLLPSPDLRGWGETHSLNGPLWSLLQEYLANLFYALVGRKLNRPALWALVLLSAAVLTVAATRRGDVATGWSHQTFWFAVVRMMYPFFAGLLLFRSGRLIRIPGAFPLSASLLTGLFCLPYFPNNGLYEAACIILAFPLIVAMGAGGRVSGAGARVCRVLADLSYPLYITHYPLIYLYIGWVATTKPTPLQALPVAAALLAVALLLAYAALKLYDEPVRAWLKRKMRQGTAAPVRPVVESVTA